VVEIILPIRVMHGSISCSFFHLCPSKSKSCVHVPQKLKLATDWFELHVCSCRNNMRLVALNLCELLSSLPLPLCRFHPHTHTGSSRSLRQRATGCPRATAKNGGGHEQGNVAWRGHPLAPGRALGRAISGIFAPPERVRPERAQQLRCHLFSLRRQQTNYRQASSAVKLHEMVTSTATPLLDLFRVFLFSLDRLVRSSTKRET